MFSLLLLRPDVLRAGVRHVHHVQLGDHEAGGDPLLVVRPPLRPGLHKLVDVPGVDCDPDPENELLEI